MITSSKTPFVVKENQKIPKNDVKATFFQGINRYRGFFFRFIIILMIIILFWSMFGIEFEHPLSMHQTCPIKNCSKVENGKVESTKGEKIEKKTKFEDFECFQFTKKNKTKITLLEDVMDSSRKPRPDSINFVETSCSKDGLIHLTPRQMCAIESTALNNPDRDIFVNFVAPVGFAADTSLESKFVSVLKSYPNIFLRNMNLSKSVKDTPVEKWFESGDLFSSVHIHVHTSDFLRLLLVYKWGGFYLDLDFVIFKNLNGLKKNFFSTELKKGRTTNSIVNFDHEGVGHDYATLMLQEFAWKFNGKCWGVNGPDLFQRVAQRTCRTSNHTEFKRERCVAFEVLPFEKFYAVDGDFEWDKIYKAKDFNWTMEKTKDSYGLHTWNTKAKSENWYKNEPKSAYSYWMEKYCPKMFAITSTDLFGTF